MAFQTTDVIDAMRRDTGLSIPVLRVDGGASANDLLLQTQSDLADLPIARPTCIETTAWGAAAMAGLTAGVYRSTDELAARTATAKVFTPHLDASTRTARLEKWHKAIESAQAFT